MRWSKLRQLVEASFADSVRGRVTVHSTKYRRPSFHRSWARGSIEIDRKPFANFDDSVSWSLSGNWAGDLLPNAAGADDTLRELNEGGYLGREYNRACWLYVHSSLNDSLRNPSPIIRGLAMLNAKVGRARLARLAAEEEHPLAIALARFRIDIEEEARARPQIAIKTLPT